LARRQNHQQERTNKIEDYKIRDGVGIGVKKEKEQHHDSMLYGYIRNKCCEKGLFTLASGQVSTSYFDLKLATWHPEMMTRIFYAIENILKQKREKIGEIGSIGGLETGALPIISHLSSSLMKPGFFIRKTKKDHGFGLVKKEIEGIVRFPVLLVDDVVTTGSSFEYVIHILEQEYGHYDTKLAGKLCVLDRRPEVYDHDYGEIISLFKESDFD
jgi:orotate phosphoribosyltransferase